MTRILKKINKRLIAFIVCMVMVLAFVSTVSATPFSVSQLTNTAYDDLYPRVSSNGDIVWVGLGSNGYPDIYVQDGVTHQTSVLTNHVSINDSPRINDRGDIVWVTYNSSEADFNIMLYTKATGTIKRISLPKDPNFTHNDKNPQINNLGRVVYQSQNLGTDYEIMSYDTVTVTQVTNNTVSDTSPMLNDNGDIVWMQNVTSGVADIYLRDGATTAITQITNTPSLNEMNPKLTDAGDIIWSGYDGSYYHLYYYKRSTGQTTKITSGSTDNMMHQTNATGQITWGSMTSNDSEIYFRSGLSGTNINISNNSQKDDGSPSINNSGWVAWDEDQGTTGTNDQIFLWDGLTPATSHVTRLNNDLYDHVFPVLNNSNIVVWQGTGGAGTTLTDYEIYAATTGLCAGVICDDGNACTYDNCDTATGACVYTPVVCNDNNLCTTDACDPATGACVYTPIVCNDNNACTDNKCDAATGCYYTPVVCTDNSLCTTDTCNTATGCVYTQIPGINDGSVCTIDTCNASTGVITHTPIVCNDNSLCTTDSCNSATGCVFTPLASINDNNACTTDACDPATGTITHTPKVCNDNNLCTDDSCNTATGACVYSSNITSCPSVTGNNFTMLDPNNNAVGGTNDVFFAWDGNLRTSVAVSGQVSNALLSSTCTFGGVSWTAHDLAVYGPGTYTVYTGCSAGSPGCGTGVPINFTVNTGEIGIHMLFNWDGNTNIDVVNIMRPNAVFAPSPMWTTDCGANSACTKWGWMSYDYNNDNKNGGPMVDGPFVGFSPNFNLIKGPVDPCCDAATRCNDNNACTTDSCDPATGVCSHSLIDCNDNNLCTNDSCNTSTGCVNAVKNCNDGLLCTTDSCDPATGACSNIAIDCNDNNACTTDSCKTTTGTCIHTPIFCADGNNCTTDVCDTAVGCTFTPIVCNDNNVCTTDSCNTATGCVYTPNTLPCSDNNGCTVNDVCSNGVCQPGAPANCDDGNICTTDVCVPILPYPYSCVNYANTLPCDDNNACTSNDTCANTVCTGTQRNCDDTDACTVDSCNTATGNCVRTLSPTCVSSCAGQPNGTACTDFNACTLNDTCSNGVCVGGTAVTCNDNNVCTTDTCDTVNGCVFTNNTAPCADRNSCTDGDYCSNGVCMSGVLRSCDDGNVCTNDAYVPIIEQCCVHWSNTLPCDDNNACTFNDVCANMACGGTPKNCDDSNTCTTDTCEPATGNCVQTQVPGCDSSCAGKPDGSACTDYNACTNDTCINQVCVSTAKTCNDNNICTDDSCDPATGCVFTNNTAPCSDGNYCTAGDICSNGVCQPGATVNCDDGNICTTDTPAPFLPGCCIHPANTLSCNDNNACTTGDVCSNSVCTGTPVSCSAGLTCNPSTGTCQ